MDSTGPDTGADSSDTTGSTSSTGSEDTGGSTTEIPAGSTSGSTSNSSTTSTTDDDSTGETDSTTDPTSTGEETCDPFSTRCLNAREIQHCNAQGLWDPPQTCVDQACVNGQCTGECAPGTTECLDLDHMRTCEDMGLWGNPSACVDQSCIGNRCTGECAQGQVRCQGNTVQRCNTVGLWKDDFDCEAPKEICEEGTCVETCTPWTKQFGTSEADGGSGIVVDISGNVFMTGEVYGTFEGQFSAGSSDIFVAKYNPVGTKLWVKQFGTADWDKVQGIAVDAAGYAFITGSTYGTFNGQSSAGSEDIFVAKYNPAGTKLWVKQLGTLDLDYGNGIAVDAAGNAFITGQTDGAFEGQSSAGSGDIFVVKFSPAGTKLWVKQFGTSDYDGGHGIAVDVVGNAFITGRTDGAFKGQSSAGRQDIFVAKFSPVGAKLWVKQLGTSDFDSGSGIAMDVAGHAFITGRTNGTFDGQSTAGSPDIFVAKYSPTGTKLWVKQLGTPYWDNGQGIAVDAIGRITITGSTQGTFAGNTSAGDWDVFIARLCDDAF